MASHRLRECTIYLPNSNTFLSLCIHMYIYNYVYIYIHIYICVYEILHSSLSLYIYIHIYIQLCIHTHIYIYVCMRFRIAPSFSLAISLSLYIYIYINKYCKTVSTYIWWGCMPCLSLKTMEVSFPFCMGKWNLHGDAAPNYDAQTHLWREVY